jgi:serine protease Do
MSLVAHFLIRGDFEANVSFEIVKANPPKAGSWLGPALYARTDPYGREAVSLAQRNLPDGKRLFVSERLQMVHGKRVSTTISSVGATSVTGRLRLERQGTRLRFRASDGHDGEFVTVGEVEFGRADVHSISLGMVRGESNGELELRLLDFRVRAEALPGLTDQGQKQVAEPLIKRLDAKQAAALEDRLQKLYARLAPSVVRILRDPKKESGFSGVIISGSGEILTVAHHGLPAKTPVKVELADGRRVSGTVLGSVKQQVIDSSRYPAADIGMVMIDEQGEWPAASLGSATHLKIGDFCLGIGNPNIHKRGQPPLIRLGRMLSPHVLGKVRTSCRIQPGDSGGPLFDLEGRVLGVAEAIEALETGINWHAPTEGFLKFRDQLRAGDQVEFQKQLPPQRDWLRDPGGAWEPTVELSKILNAAHKSTVEVLGNGKVIALGVIVDPDGWILTKRSELTGPSGLHALVCRLSDGRNLKAQLAGESRSHDLALLNVSRKGLAAVQWAKSEKPRIGQLAASLGANGQPLRCGVIGAVSVKNPGVRGALPLYVKPAADGVRGVVFVEFLPKRLEVDDARVLLKAGDVITHLDDVPTPTMEEFAGVQEKRTAAPNALAGERIKLTVEREGKTRQVFMTLVEPSAPIIGVWKVARWNVRRTGFPDVFCHDGCVAYDRCGGAVVDRSGQVIGINIARADPMQTFAIRSSVVLEVIAEMKVASSR